MTRYVHVILLPENRPAALAFTLFLDGSDVLLNLADRQRQNKLLNTIYADHKVKGFSLRCSEDAINFGSIA